MDLSIIIVNWNSKDDLARAVAAVQAAPTALRHEIVVIDSGSFDGSAEMLRDQYPEVRFVQAESNLGFARANNRAFELARGRLLLFLNPDTEVIGDAIDALARQLDAQPRAAIAGPRLLNGDGSVQDTCIRALPTILNQVLDADVLRRRFPRSRLWGDRSRLVADSSPFRVEAVSGACLMMKRAAFEAVGRFSTDYFMYAEDMDLCLKAQRAGGQVWCVPAAAVVHHGGTSSARSPVSMFSAVMAFESHWRFFRKTRSAAYAAAYRGAMAATSALRVAALLLAWAAHACDRGWWGRQALGKWSARLRWSLGGERWVRDFRNVQVATEDRT